MAGVPDLLKLNWVTTNFPIEEKLVLELVSTQYTYTALRYDRILGWLGYGEVLPVGSYSLYVRVYNVMSPPSNAEIKSYETVYVKRMPQEA